MRKENKLIQFPAFIAKVSTLVDGGNSLLVHTRELVPEDMTVLFSMRNQEGFFIFKGSNVKEEDLRDVPEVPSEFKGDKTPSQRLRAVLYVLWEQNRKGDKPFEQFYREYMERLIEKIKEGLN